MVGDEGRRKIKLFCPSVSKTIDWVTWNEQKLDFGSIAAAFGLEPSTVKLNGHFISRGIDLIASCVTWRSLLAFFSVKGLSTGEDDTDALRVDGKLSSKVGIKRTYSDCGLGLTNNKKLKDTCSAAGEEEALVFRSCNDLGSKRKLVSEDTQSVKKLKLTKNDDSFDVAGSNRGVSSSGSTKTPLRCSFMNGGLKRTRDDEMIASASYKRIR